jgi:hypothetical protein
MWFSNIGENADTSIGSGRRRMLEDVFWQRSIACGQCKPVEPQKYMHAVSKLTVAPGVLACTKTALGICRATPGWRVAACRSASHLRSAVISSARTPNFGG